MSSSVLKDRLAIFGGTFDPPHKTHIQVVEQACQLAGIHHVKVVPCHIPPLKSAPSVTSEHRVNMLQLAIDGKGNFSIDTRELESDVPSYTVNTLKQLKAENPNTTLYFIMGTDNLLSFTRWHQWQEILTLCHLLVCRRNSESNEQTNPIDKLDNEPKKRITQSLEQYESQDSGLIYLADTDINNISSTSVRKLLKHHQDVSEWIEPAVYDYIKHHGLYQDSSNNC
ncbi:nicotinate-nucleotide adenylyltransferase [Alteromonadaceae bacterium M269]|nr:nicotinate-nucleotide adenylyltransferase [Alteromonadaceae bacterium M269]